MNKARYALITGWFFSMAAWAAPAPIPDYCDDPSGWQTMEDFLQSAPNDELIIRLYSLRLGLCQLIKAKKIDAQLGINLFEEERQRAIDRRTLDEQRSHNQSAHSL